MQKTRKLVENNKVDILAGVYTSSTALAIRDYIDQNKTVTVIANAGANAITGERFSKYFFRISFSNGQISYPLGEWAYKNVGKKAVLIAPDYAAGKESNEGFRLSFTKAGGTVLKELNPALGKTSDYAPYLTQIQDAKPELCYAFLSGTDAINFVKQYEQLGLKKTIPLIGFSMIDEGNMEAYGTAVVDVRNVGPWSLKVDNAANKKFIQDVQTKFNRLPTSGYQAGYDAAQMVAEGIKANNGDTTNKDALIKAMEGVKFTSPRGPVSFDASTHGITQNLYLTTAFVGADGKIDTRIIETFPSVPDINAILKK